MLERVVCDEMRLKQHLEEGRKVSVGTGRQNRLSDVQSTELPAYMGRSEIQPLLSFYPEILRIAGNRTVEADSQ